MEKIWIIAIAVFLASTSLFWRITRGHFKREYGKKVWKQWGTKTFYWQGAIFVGSGVTFLVIFLLKSTDLLNF